MKLYESRHYLLIMSEYKGIKTPINVLPGDTFSEVFYDKYKESPAMVYKLIEGYLQPVYSAKLVTLVTGTTFIIEGETE